MGNARTVHKGCKAESINRSVELTADMLCEVFIGDSQMSVYYVKVLRSWQRR